MKKIFLMAFVAMEFLTGLAAKAASPFEGAASELDKAGKKGYGETASGDLPVLLGSIVKVLLGVLGAVLVLIIIRGGILYMNAGGDPKDVEKAKAYIKNGIIGFIIVALAYALTSYVVLALGRAMTGTPTPPVPPG